MLPLRSVKLFTQFLLLFEAIAPNFLFVGANEANSNGIDGLYGKPTNSKVRIENRTDVDSNGAKPTECPAEDSACVRPNYTYIEMIAMAIESVPSKQMRVSGIYQYFMDKFAYFRNEGECWRRNVRKILSCDRKFARVPNDWATGPSHYWTLSEYIDTITRVQNIYTSAIPARHYEPDIKGTDPTECPPENSACVKPDYSYSELVIMAIESAPNKQMKVSEIYQYLKGKFEYFRNEGKCWRNNIRNALNRTPGVTTVLMDRKPGIRKIYWTLSKYTGAITQMPGISTFANSSRKSEYLGQDTAGTEPRPYLSENSACIRPNYSYSKLIEMAINSVPTKRMKVAEIYKYIMDKFEYFRNDGKCWRANVRNELSKKPKFAIHPRDVSLKIAKKVYWTLSKYIKTTTRVPSIFVSTTLSRKSGDHGQTLETDETTCPPENSGCRKPSHLA
ncbi:uncharacterized protein [Bemisia tabaci]|uniref:uncharacterized protein isoform X1 n=2 Tax=Bemisia tabaci TaxID=7038 RepID=UPI003B27DD7C